MHLISSNTFQHISPILFHLYSTTKCFTTLESPVPILPKDFSGKQTIEIIKLVPNRQNKGNQFIMNGVSLQNCPSGFSHVKFGNMKNHPIHSIRCFLTFHIFSYSLTLCLFNIAMV